MNHNDFQGIERSIGQWDRVIDALIQVGGNQDLVDNIQQYLPENLNYCGQENEQATVFLTYDQYQTIHDALQELNSIEVQDFE